MYLRSDHCSDAESPKVSESCHIYRPIFVGFQLVILLLVTSCKRACRIDFALSQSVAAPGGPATICFVVLVNDTLLPSVIPPFSYATTKKDKRHSLAPFRAIPLVAVLV